MARQAALSAAQRFDAQEAAARQAALRVRQREEQATQQAALRAAQRQAAVDAALMQAAIRSQDDDRIPGTAEPA